MKAPTTIFLLRHASSRPDYNIPESQWPLSDDGLRQSRELVQKLVLLEVSAIYSSPYGRARETVRPFAEHSGQTVLIHDDLRERKLTPTQQANWLELVERSFSDDQFAVPGGESAAQAYQRFRTAVAQIAERHLGQRVLVASHGNVIALFLKGLNNTFGFLAWKQMPNPALYRIEFMDSGPRWDESFRVVH